MAITSKVKFLCYNILEEGTVTVTGEDSGYPNARLYDRSLGFYCKYSALGAYYVTVSGNSLTVDTLVVEGHNLDGVACYWQYSDDGANWTSAVTDWTQSGSGQIFKQLTAQATHDYWRFYTGSIAFQATEIFMGGTIAIPVIWDSQPRLWYVGDVQWQRTYGGVDHSIRIGAKRRARAYQAFSDRVTYPIATLRANLDYLSDFYKPFYFIDHEGSCFLAKFDGSLPEESHMNEGILTLDFVVLEIPS